MIITNGMKLIVIEQLIERYRELRNDPDDYTHATLKAIADDIRAPSKSSDTIDKLEKAIARAHIRKTTTGYATGSLQEVAELTIGRWPTIRHALESVEQKP